MSELDAVWQEQMTVNLKGGTADNHEVDALLLCESLQGLAKLAEKASTNLNSTGTKLSVKVKGGFVQGSFDYTLIFDFVGATMPVIPQVVQTLQQLFSYRSFLQGEEPQSISPSEGGNMSVTNHSGEVTIINNSTIILNNNPTTPKAIKQVFKPFENGLDEISFAQGSSEPVAFTKEKKDIFLNPKIDPSESEDSVKQLEIITPHLDGRTTGWRFYDDEDDVVFTATVEDHIFIKSIIDKQCSFARGQVFTATVRTDRKKIDGRKRTERTILHMTPAI